MWLEAKLTRIKDLEKQRKDKEVGGLTFKPKFVSKKYADKLGINRSMEKKRRPISGRRRSSKRNPDMSMLSTLSGRSVSRALRDSRSYSNIYSIRKEVKEAGEYC